MHIPRFTGIEATGRPIAEMWMGAHPAGSSILEDGRRLDDAIRDEPEGILGAEVCARFGPRPPFLMKLLAAAEPLSLQVHPTSEHARTRYSEQEVAGIPLTAPDRSYQDPFHKPELIYALTRFEGMAGFRDPFKTAQIVRGLQLSWLDEVADRLQATLEPIESLQAVTTELLAMNGPTVVARLQELRDAAVQAAAESHVPDARRRPPPLPPDDVSRESRRVYEAVAKLVDKYPQDPGVLVTLLLNHVVLAAGEAMYVEAGIIHAYTSGFGVEIMASSDNVLRAGLTPKHVATAELLEITDFTPVPPPLWTSGPCTSGGVSTFAPPVDEFELLIVEVTEPAVRLDSDGPHVVLALENSTILLSQTGRLHLERGAAALVTAEELPVEVSSGRAAVGRVPAVLRA